MLHDVPIHTHVVSLSGGMDSATLLGQVVRYYQARQSIHQPKILAVGFTYGSKHNKYETAAAIHVADHYGVEYHLLNLTEAMGLFKSDLLLTGGDIPEGHYEAETMKATVVPCRNLIFASILAGIAQSNCKEGEKAVVSLGVHAGDHAIYPDCRQDFINALNYTVHKATSDSVQIHAPFLQLSKGDIVKIGLELGVPYSKTRTCYKDQQKACGKCGSCQERLEAFQMCNAIDPIEYVTRAILPKTA